jgi:nitrous oxide reductase
MTTQARADILNPDRRQLLGQAAMTAVAAASGESCRERRNPPVPR